MKTKPATVIKKPVIAPPRVTPPPRVSVPPRVAPLPRVAIQPRVSVPPRVAPPQFPVNNFRNEFVLPFQPAPANFPETFNPPQIPMKGFDGLSEGMLQDLAGRYGLDANALFGKFPMPQVSNQQMPNQSMPFQQMPNNGFANQLPITGFPDTNQPFMQPSTSPNGMTQYDGNIGYTASRGYMGQPSTSYNQINPMQQPMQGYPLYPADNQMNPMQQPMQGYQQQPMLPQSSYQLQQPQQPPQQSMYPASGGFGNTMQNQNQNQNQNIGGLFGAIGAMNKNNFSY